MSKIIDEKIVEMKFDNRNFEKNVGKSMNTLDKLKTCLNFDESTMSLKKMQNTANKMDMNILSNSLTTLKNKFSAIQVMGVTALANITNSAINAGKRIASALTIQPIHSRF